ncbi:MAG TPA: NADH-quinone oxidoreductase subunit L [Acidobacteriota bacterium]|nr:NADH-quinone oxidoreductase subunit L [Acidobacteriota bacterium]
MQLHSFSLLFLIPLLPLLGAIYNAFLGRTMQRRFGRPAVHLPAIILPWCSFLVAVAAFVVLARQEAGTAVYQHLWDWLHVGVLRADLAFLMDPLACVMTLVITFVGSLIHVYSIGYMKDDPSYWRFFACLNLFMFAMLVLVLGDNLLLMFLGWEGVGLCSYLLIGFWYKEREKAAAGMKAFVVNRVGDFGFSLGVFLLFWGLFIAAPGAALMNAGHQDKVSPFLSTAAANAAIEGVAPRHAETVSRADVSREASMIEAGGHHASYVSAEGPVTSVAFRDMEKILRDPARREAFLSQSVLGIGIVTMICLLLFLGAAGKSAQLPLHVWLPDAMAGPTPVSALIHAATMVTAGVYMVARLHFVFALSPAAMTVVALVGALTALLAATIALFQYDIKKVLAYSTVSQLGFMFVAVGVGAWWVGIFHLMTHAFFKACLFLGSGSVIAGCHHEQDMRKMGGLRKLMPVTALTYLIACTAIAGFPFFSGFFSKEEILWAAFNSGTVLLPGGGIVIWGMISVAALFTAFYMFRSYYMTFSGAYRGAVNHGDASHAGGHGMSDDHSAGGAHGGLPRESPRSMTIVLVVLGVLAVAGGYVGLPHFWNLPNLIEPWLAPVFAGSRDLIAGAGHPYSLKWMVLAVATILAFAGFLAARWLYLDAKNPLPGRLLENPSPLIRGVHRLVYNKYYFDEFYDASFVKGSLKLSRLLSWGDRNVIDGAVNLCGSAGRAASRIQGLIDRYVVDGLVNLVAEVILRGGKEVRLIQTGRVQTYVYGLFAGAVVLVIMACILGL